jgi:hypothetical protein
LRDLLWDLLEEPFQEQEMNAQKDPPNPDDVIKKHVSALAEHYDSVHIFITKYDSTSGITRAASFGCGDFYARFGNVREWTLRMEENAKEEVRGKRKET